MSYSYIRNSGSDYVGNLYEQYKRDPQSVDREWARFFEGFEFSLENTLKPKPSSVAIDKGSESAEADKLKVISLIEAYRTKGHQLAAVDPLGIFGRRQRESVDLSLGAFGLEGKESRSYHWGEGNPLNGTLGEIVSKLKKVYTGSVGVETAHCSGEVRDFVAYRMESRKDAVSAEEKKRFFGDLNRAAGFESFLQSRFVGKKRFSLEGVDSLIPVLNHISLKSTERGVEEWVVGMAHRGRLNVLVNVFGKPCREIFSEFEELKFSTQQGSGDVKYHLGRLLQKKNPDGKNLRMELLYNPSHLETVNAVALGFAKGRMEEFHGGESKKVLPLLIHGDASLAGQGIVYETLNMWDLEGVRVGGTFHLVINNQIGYTANPWESRSTLYCTDIAKMVGAPVFHVNSEDVESAVWLGELALEIRQTFAMDVFLDLVGFRRYGHNEADEPRYTQPHRYELISHRGDARVIYGKQLVDEGVLSETELERLRSEYEEELSRVLEEVKGGQGAHTPYQFDEVWKPYVKKAGEKEILESVVQTAADRSRLEKIAKTVFKQDLEHFAIYSKSKKLLEQREIMWKDDSFDWSMGEMFAYGSLLLDGYGVRLMGEDSQRGTFSHRQGVLVDVETEEKYLPLQHLEGSKGTFEMYNSLLSEYGSLGFEYGYSLSHPKKMVIWEAQFGDFVNGAQIVIDQYITSAEAKWQMLSALVTYLPHGYEGQGPEHSSARPERFLQLCAGGNMIVSNVTTPANLFHLLRRQMLGDYRKPLVIFTPKSLLRNPQARSRIADFTEGSFQCVLDDPFLGSGEGKREGKDGETFSENQGVKKVFLCTGRIYYDAISRREALKREDLAFVRLEQLYPLDEKALEEVLSRYPKGKLYWLQEEPENMGFWWYIAMKMGKKRKLEVISRKANSSPASGKANKSSMELEECFEEVFK